MKLRLAEIFGQLPDQRTIGGCFQPPGDIAKVLLDHALLTLRALGQHRSQLRRRRKLRIGDAGNRARGIDREVHGLRRNAPAAALAARDTELKGKLLAPRADGVELLESEADR